MSKTSTIARRSTIVIAVVGSLLLGFGAIRASAVWTQAAAPLPVTPVSIETLQSHLTDESARSAILLDRLSTLTGHADELSTALTVAQTRIAADDAHAAQLAKDLAAAKKKLAKLEKSIKAASQARVVRTTASTTSSASRPAGGGGEEGPHDD